MITPLPGAMTMKPGSAGRPFFGVDAHVIHYDNCTAQVMHDGERRAHKKAMKEGYLVFGAPWPGIARTIFNDHARFEETYFKQFPGYYVTGDDAVIDGDGDFWITGIYFYLSWYFCS